MFVRITVFFLVVVFTSFKANAAEGDQDSPESKIHEKLDEMKAQVANAPKREIAFSELRSFQFRNQPIELKGIIRLWKEVAISIEYPENGTILILDEEGVLLRKRSAKGSLSEKQTDMKDGATAGLLKAALDFDRAELERLFLLTWFEEEDGWSIVMTPRRDEEKSIEQLTMTGHGTAIDRIEIGFGGRNGISIFPQEERIVDEFSPEDQSTYFRKPLVEGR